jgi:hypothetical protein
MAAHPQGEAYDERDSFLEDGLRDHLSLVVVRGTMFDAVRAIDPPRRSRSRHTASMSLPSRLAMRGRAPLIGSTPLVPAENTQGA